MTGTKGPGPETEVSRLAAEVGRLRAERDAVVRLCVLKSNSIPPYWSFVGNMQRIPFADMAPAETYLKAVAAVRRAAGLAPEGEGS